MPRIARVVIPGCPHHVTQRGNHGQKVFFSDRDRQIYFELLRKYFEQYLVDVAGYTLMSNHTHLIVVPLRKNSLAKGVGISHNDFSRWQQVQQNQKGHLWQSRFYSNPLDEEHYWKALRYAELNPVRAGLVRHAWDWPWSSARAHVTGVDETGILNMDLWRSHFNEEQWGVYLKQRTKLQDEIELIRLSARTGRPLGDKNFIKSLEKITGRSLLPKKRGPKFGSKRKGRG